MKFTQDDFQPSQKKQDISQLEADYLRMQNESMMLEEEREAMEHAQEDMEEQHQLAIIKQKEQEEHDYQQKIVRLKKKKFEDEDDDYDPFINTDNSDDGLNLPNVIILVSDNVKLIRMNALPMLQV